MQHLGYFSNSVKKAIFYLFLLFSLPMVWGQAYDVQKLGEEQGLYQNYIYSIVQDQTGFLWLGAGEGLVRFDGQNFQTFGSADGIADDFVTVSFLDSKGRIWFGHNSGGLTLMENDSFRVVTLGEEIISTITGITEGDAGEIWVATQRNGLIKIQDGDKIESFSEGFSGIFVYAMTYASGNRLLLGTGEGLRVYDLAKGGAPALSYSVFETELTKIECIFPGRDGKTFWIGTEDEGFARFVPEGGKNYQLEKFSAENGFQVSKVPVIFEDLGGSLFVGTAGNGFKKYGKLAPAPYLKEIRPLHATDSTYLNDIISSIYQDKFGQIWLGTYGNGLVSMVEEMFVVYEPEEDSEIENIRSIIGDSQNNLWFSRGKELFVVSAEKMLDHGFQYTASNGMPLRTEKKYSAENGLPDDEISALHEGPDGNIWIGTENQGVFVLDPKTETIDSLPLSKLNLSKSINIIRSDNEGNIWIGTKGGAYIYTPSTGERKYYNTRNGLSHNNIYDIYADEKNLVWIATHSNRASIFDGKSFEVIPKNNDEGIPNIFSITVDAENSVWLGTDGGGLYRYQNEAFENINADSGLVSNYCYLLVNDKQNNLWAAHRNGLSRYILKTGTIIPYVGGDQFPIKETTMNAVYLDIAGNLWFGTQFGVIKYNSFYDQFENFEPKTMILGVENLETGEPITATTSLKYDQYRIKIDYLGLTFVDQQAVKYQYQLNNLGWSEITSRNSVTYEGLAEGDYTFKVRAMNKQGLWNDKPVEISFSIAPPFWKTWWFRGIGLLLIIAVLYGYIRYRTYVLNKEKENLEQKVKERTIELEKVNQELEKLSLVASETDNAVYILDDIGDLVWINEGFTRMTNFTYEEILEKRKGRQFLDTSSNSAIRYLLEKVKRDRTSATYESTIPSKAGGEIPVLSTLNIIYNEDGGIKYVVIIDSDISELKKAEERVQQMNTQLEEKVRQRTAELAIANSDLEHEKEELKRTAKLLHETNQELDTFIYRASHDLKGPLASLVGLIEIAVSEVEDPVASTYLGLMEKSSKKLDGVLVDLLEATKVKQAKIEPRNLNIHAVAHKALRDAQMESPSGNLAIDLQIEDPFTVMHDRTILHAIFLNFILNGIQYQQSGRENPWFRLTVSRIEGGKIKILAEDNGTGIPEKMQSRVFDMFFRGTERSQGSGLGLYTVRIAAEKVDGTWGMTSVDGEGSTFWVELPEDISSYAAQGKDIIAEEG